MISVLFLKFVGRVKKKKIPYFGDGFRESLDCRLDMWEINVGKKIIT